MENAGKLAWIGPLIDILALCQCRNSGLSAFSNVPDTGKPQSEKLLPDQSFLKNASPSMDNVREENIENLIQAGLAYID